jgi:hypothetical protein
LYTLRRAPKLDIWGNFVGKLRTLHKNVQELILKKLHGGTKVWCIQLEPLIIDIAYLIKYKRWLLVMVCLLMLIPVKKVPSTYQIS